jgi:hypothetical protein
MLRRTLSSLVSVSGSESKIFSDQENETNFDPNSLPTPSPNRSKYEGKFMKTKQRRPLEEKTNKSNKNVENLTGKSNDENFEFKMKKSSNEEDKNNSNEEVKEKKFDSTNANNSISSNPNANISFQDLFQLNTNNTNNNSSTSKVEELSMALSETLKENEQLHDTVSLLKAEIDRLNTELLEYQEYAELYLLGKELIENQAEEIENIKKKLVKRD